jgi:hypothetical protein
MLKKMLQEGKLLYLKEPLEIPAVKITNQKAYLISS